MVQNVSMLIASQIHMSSVKKVVVISAIVLCCPKKDSLVHGDVARIVHYGCRGLHHDIGFNKMQAQYLKFCREPRYTL